MSIKNEIERLKLAKSELFIAINSKGGALEQGQSISDYAFEVGKITSVFDLPAVNVTSEQLLAGTTALDSKGNVVTGNIGEVFLEIKGPDITVGKGYSPAEQSCTVKSGSVTLSGAVVSVKEGYVNASELVVPASEISETDSSVTIGKGYIAQEMSFSKESSAVSLPEVTFSSSDLRLNRTAINSSGEVITGTMPDSVVSKNNSIITVSRGYSAEDRSFSVASPETFSNARLFCATLIFK